MGRSNRSKSVVGKGKVTPMQVAYLVDRYLCENRFVETRSVFRSEASSLISKSPLRQAPCSLIPLDDILNEYINLKEQKVIVDQDKAMLDQEKTRVQNLLHGMQNVMNAYNSTSSPPPRAITSAAPAAIQTTSQPSNNMDISPSGGIAHITPNHMAPSLPGNKRVGSFTVPSSTQSITKKRKTPEVSLPPAPSPVSTTAKIQRAATPTNYLTFQTSTKTKTPVDNNSVSNESSGTTSSMAKCLFTRSEVSPPPSNPACLRTPSMQVSPHSDVPITPTNCTVVTKERITVSPHKQNPSYTLERSHMVSSFSPAKLSKRDHVKGRLNFDDDAEATINLDPPASEDFVSTSSSASEADLFDIDFLSDNFPFSEVLVDFDIACQGMPDPLLTQPSNCSFQLA